jgi:fatty acid amide hydrolase 2
VARLDGLRADLEGRLGPDAVLLHPPYSRPAPRHFTPLVTPLDFACCGIFNALEMPATAVPAGFDAHGLPLSVQVVGRRGDDHLTIAVAMALERFLGGYTRAEPRPAGR